MQLDITNSFNLTKMAIPESEHEPDYARDTTNKMSPNFKRDGALKGYTGHFPSPKKFNNELTDASTKNMIRGYTGHRPGRSHVVGEPIIPNEEKQSPSKQISSSGDLSVYSPKHEGAPQTPSFASEQLQNTFRNYAAHMDTLERYHSAVEQLIQRGQSQEMLLRIVQAKMSQRVSSFSAQVIKTRKLYEAFDLNSDGLLDENEFRICLEKLNIQFDDVQNLALFAYFDVNNDG
jgi:hypothetical protein